MNAIAAPENTSVLAQEVVVDPVTYEVIRHRLMSIVEQQSAVLKNISGSPLVTESNDCNTGLYLPDGQIVAMGPHIVFHSGSMEQVVSHIAEECDPDPGINEGDVFITNDPYRGALHLPDVTMLEPVVYNGERVGWVGSCCHVLDIGGMTASSWCPDATQAYQEGLILPPTKLVEGGKIRSDVWRLILSASRLPANLGLDLKAMIAANTHARKGFVRLIERYGLGEVKYVMRTMLDKSEAAVRQRIATLPDATFRARTYFDHDGREANLTRVAVEMTKKDDELHFDFADSSPQMPGIYNCAKAGLLGGVFASVLPVLAPDIPWNSGVMRALQVTAPEGSVVNAQHPAPCGAATIGGAYLVKNVAHTVVSALASTHSATRPEAMAQSTGAIQVMHLGGLNQYGEGFGGAITEALAGGGGATTAANGIDYAGPHEILAYKIQNVEGDESAFPLLWLRRQIKTDSCGAGRHHGGATLDSSFTVHDARFVHSVLMTHSMSMPSSSGLHGGLPGSTHEVTISRGTTVKDKIATGTGIQRGTEAGGESVEYSGTPGELMLFPGDVVDWSFHGGGGFGDPLDADPDMVLEDVKQARISVEASERFYGVVLENVLHNAEHGTVNHSATAARRAEARAIRRSWTSTPAQSLPLVSEDAQRRPVADRLQLVSAKDGSGVFGCVCGHLLSASTANWKAHAGRRVLHGKELGFGVRLHPALTAEAFACPSCGGLLAVEVRAADDPVLHELEIA